MSVTEPAEVCIIGGGVAASMLAFELARHGIPVLILEAGPRHDPAKRYEYMRKKIHGIGPWESNNPERDRYTSDGNYPYPLNLWRVKAVGGSGLHWGGDAVRLHESDFELRSRYGMGMDWPIHYGDLERYYSSAEKLIGVAGADSYPWTPWRSEKYPMPPFPFSYSDKILQPGFDRLGIPLHHQAVAKNSLPYDGRPPCMSFAVCSACPIFAKWTPDLLITRAEKTGTVTVKPDTRVTRIHCNKTGMAVESVTAASFVNGEPSYADYHASVFVLAAHAVESTRLLLLSKSAVHPRGLGNNTGHVGKHFTDHISLALAAELPEKTYTERVGFGTSVSFYFYESSRKKGGNAFTLLPLNRTVRSPWDVANEELQKQTIWGNELRTRVRDQFGYTAAIEAAIEQLPYEENRVSLDENVTDDLGLPVPKIIYSFQQERELRTIEKATAVIRQIFETLRAREIRQLWLGPSAHQMGTCRMADDGRSGVVDRNLRVHGVGNLFIAGSSVFPACGAAPPTLTIAALALRLGDHLSSKLGRKSNAVLNKQPIQSQAQVV